MTDVHAELKRVAARARRDVAKRFPVGAAVRFRRFSTRSMPEIGVVAWHRHAGRSASVEIGILVTDPANRGAIWTVRPDMIELVPEVAT